MNDLTREVIALNLLHSVEYRSPASLTIEWRLHSKKCWVVLTKTTQHFLECIVMTSLCRPKHGSELAF